MKHGSVAVSSIPIRLDEAHYVEGLISQTIRRQLGIDVIVKVTRETVALNGVVESWHHKQQAQECIRGVVDGRLIDNSLQVSIAAEISWMR